MGLPVLTLTRISTTSVQMTSGGDPLTSLLRLGTEGMALTSTYCSSRIRKHKSLPPDCRVSVKGYRASRAVPSARKGLGLGLDMLPALSSS